MKNVIDLFRLRFKLLQKGSVLVIPTVFTAVFMGSMYSMAPIDICSSFLLSAVFLYFICIFISMSIHGKENDVFEETLLLHCKNSSTYFLSRELVMVVVSCGYAIILTAVPPVLFLINSTWFSRNMSPADVICGGAYILMCGICGMVTGDFFHPRIIVQRKAAIICVILVSVLAVCKKSLIESFAFLNILHFVLPPFMDGFGALVDKEYFKNAEIFLICLHMIIFAIVAAFIKIKLLRIRRFRY